MSSSGNHKTINANLISLPASSKNNHQQQQIQQQFKEASQKQTSTSSVSTVLSQLQTTATVHQPSAQSACPSATSRDLLQQIKIARSNNQQHNIIPPRYQPPPQPTGGILKHLSGRPSSYYSSELTASHLNIKYPPEIPKLAPLFLPDSENSNRFTHRLPHHRLASGGTGQLLTSKNDETHAIRSQQQQEMLKFVRKSDQENSVVVGSAPTRLTAEQNRQLQSLVSELRALKESNQRLSDDNQELRDLCCFLDDDRQKGRKLAREWQRFGRYTASVMRQEVSAYQSKLRQLDDKQQELIRDNLELKELCLYLDEERAHVAANNLCANCGTATRPVLRDDGDGSSYSTNPDEAISTMRNYERPIQDFNIRATLSDQTLQYVRSLEQRIQQLEEERVSGTSTSNAHTLSDPISGRPEAVVRALQVLEVREQLERDRICNLTESQTEQMDDGEKALVREMCNVVWRKLEESPDGPGLEQ